MNTVLLVSHFYFLWTFTFSKASDIFGSVLHFVLMPPTHAHAHTHTHIHTHTAHTLTHTRAHSQTQTHTHIHTRTHMHTHTRTHTHTHAHTITLTHTKTVYQTVSIIRPQVYHNSFIATVCLVTVAMRV